MMGEADFIFRAEWYKSPLSYAAALVGFALRLRCRDRRAIPFVSFSSPS